VPETDNTGLVTVGLAPPKPGEAFQDFFRQNRTDLIRKVMKVGARREEAEDAVSETMREIMGRWDVIEFPLAYAKKAALNHFMKARARDRERTTREQSPRASSPHLSGQEELSR
jgi:DNA-directed RNA polymerase specialized sigma24 family protein